MTLFIQNNATGAGAGSLDPNQAAVDLGIIANGDTGLGLAPAVGNRQQVTYAQTLTGNPPNRLNNLVNTNFNPNYGGGPQNVNIVILPVLANFTLNDGTSILTMAGTALPPQGSGLVGAGLNNTIDCLVIYDTTQNNGDGYCLARAGTGGTLDLQIPNPVMLYHELSHSFRVVTNALLATTVACNPSSPEENAAIVDENDLRTQIATATGATPVLRDTGIHCGTTCTGDGPNCCIVASVASGSPISEEVAALRSVRDGLLRKTEIGFSFFQSLHHDYYGFSPQVSTLMAQHPALRPLVLEGFVRPFVNILRLVEQYALSSGTPASLGERFVADHADRAVGAARLDMLRQAREVLNGNEAGLTDTERELAHFLYPALASEHLRWAILELIQIYQSALQAYFDGCSVEQLGEQLYNGICSWVVRMPLDAVWASLSVAQLRDELELLESFLFRTADAKASLRDRLKRKFGTVTAIATVLDEKRSRTGENE